MGVYPGLVDPQPTEDNIPTLGFARWWRGAHRTRAPPDRADIAHSSPGSWQPIAPTRSPPTWDNVGR